MVKKNVKVRAHRRKLSDGKVSYVKAHVRETDIKRIPVKKKKYDIVVGIHKDDSRWDTLEDLIQDLNFSEVECRTNRVIIKNIDNKDLQKLNKITKDLGLHMREDLKLTKMH